jgi:hypothetical protein
VDGLARPVRGGGVSRLYRAGPVARTLAQWVTWTVIGVVGRPAPSADSGGTDISVGALTGVSRERTFAHFDGVTCDIGHVAAPPSSHRQKCLCHRVVRDQRRARGGVRLLFINLAEHKAWASGQPNRREFGAICRKPIMALSFVANFIAERYAAAIPCEF